MGFGVSGFKSRYEFRVLWLNFEHHKIWAWFKLSEHFVEWHLSVYSVNHAITRNTPKFSVHLNALKLNHSYFLTYKMGHVLDAMEQVAHVRGLKPSGTVLYVKL
jgi:hypothetical protein